MFDTISVAVFRIQCDAFSQNRRLQVPFETPRHRERRISMRFEGGPDTPLDVGANAGSLDIYRDLDELHRAVRCGYWPAEAQSSPPSTAGVGVAIAALRPACRHGAAPPPAWLRRTSPSTAAMRVRAA
jgi:hypothetical protein